MRLLTVLLLFGVSFAMNAQYYDQLKDRLDTLSDVAPGLSEKVDFTLSNAPLYELLRAVAETHNLNVSLNNLPEIFITNNFTNVTVKDLFLFVCKEHNLRIRFVNNIFAFYEEVSPVIPVAMVEVKNGDLVDLSLRNADLMEFARELTSKTDHNLVVNGGLQNKKANLFIKNLPIEEALNHLADVNGLELTKKGDKVYQLDIHPDAGTGTVDNRRAGSNLTSSRRRNSGYELQTFKNEGVNYLSLSCVGLEIQPLLSTISEELQIDYVFLTQLRGTMDASLDSIRFDDFLDIALETSGLSYSIDDSGVFMIGTQNTLGLNESKIYTFKNRSVEGVLEIIPQTLLSQVSTKPFNDLNALILTGSEREISKLVSFLNALDRPVPNVLIEVMVVEFRKGYSLSTGIKAFLGDSIPATSGQVFGGVDATISSSAINKILSNMDDRGVMNLGQVTPRFYATLQAMEDNNNLDIKSTPKLSTLNGHEATLRIGQSVYYLVETQNVTGGVNPIVTVTPRYENVEANLDIKITPFVSELEDVTLTISAEFSDFIAPTVEGAPPGNATRKFISKIRVKNQETIVLGGLEEESDIESGSGVPILSRIPVLKWIFSSRSKQTIDGKLIIFIKPTIVY